MKKLLTICELERMGDIVTSEPIFRHLKEKYPDRCLRWYTRPDFAELLRYCPAVDEVVCVGSAAEYLEQKQTLPPDTLSFELNFRSPAPAASAAPAVSAAPVTDDVLAQTPSLLEQFARSIGLDLPDETPQFHFRPGLELTGLPERYAVFHCTSNGRSRQWPARNWNRLARMVLAAGIPVVEIGIHPQLHLTGSGYIDRAGKMDLQLAAKIIAGARFFVGVESGFGHIANAVGTFAMILSGKLRKMPEYNLYSGRFRRGENCNILRFYDCPAPQLPLDAAETVLRRILDGTPMTQAECEASCLKMQIRKLHRMPFYRLERLLLGPLEELRSRIAFYRIRHQ